MNVKQGKIMAIKIFDLATKFSLESPACSWTKKLISSPGFDVVLVV